MMFTTIWHAQSPSDLFHTAHLTPSMAAAEVCYSSDYISAGARNAEGCSCCPLKGEGVQLPSSSTCHPCGVKDNNPTLHHHGQSPCRCHHPCQFYNSNPLHSYLLTSYHNYRYCCCQNHHSLPSSHQQRGNFNGASSTEKSNTDTENGDDKLSGGEQGAARQFINPHSSCMLKEPPQTSQQGTTKAYIHGCRPKHLLECKAKQRKTTSYLSVPSKQKSSVGEKDELSLQRRCEQIALELAGLAEEFGREVEWKLGERREEEESGLALLANLASRFLTNWLLPRGRDWVVEWLVGAV